MSVIPWVNIGKSALAGILDISKVEQLKDAKYVGDFCLKNSMGGWSDMPVSVFYQRNPAPEHGRYFGLFMRDGNIMICDASSTVGIPIQGVQAESGEVIYSRFRHDFRFTTCGSVFVDGGRDYLRASHGAKFVTLMIEDDAVIIVEDPDPLYVAEELKK